MSSGLQLRINLETFFWLPRNSKRIFAKRFFLEPVYDELQHCHNSDRDWQAILMNVQGICEDPDHSGG